MTLHVPEMHGGAVFESVGVLVVVENRRWKLTREHYRMANMIEDLEYVTISRSVPVFVNPSKGGDFKVNPRPAPGGGCGSFAHTTKC